MTTTRDYVRESGPERTTTQRTTTTTTNARRRGKSPAPGKRGVSPGYHENPHLMELLGRFAGFAAQ